MWENSIYRINAYVYLDRTFLFTSLVCFKIKGFKLKAYNILIYYPNMGKHLVWFYT